jgi:ABC-type lipoprotein export system ATPase subunit
MKTEAVLSLTNLDKIFSNLEATLPILKDVNFTLFPGDIVALTGASGAGKTTLLQIMGLLDEPTSGSVTVCGERFEFAAINGQRPQHPQYQQCQQHPQCQQGPQHQQCPQCPQHPQCQQRPQCPQCQRLPQHSPRSQHPQYSQCSQCQQRQQRSQRKKSLRDTTRKNFIGFVYQYHYLLHELTALENVILPQLINNVSAAAAKQHACELLDELGLSQRLNHTLHSLSGGEQQRVAIARAIANKPTILLADEPTGNLDNVTARQVFDTLLSLVNERKIAMVIATHNTDMAKMMGRRVHISQGRLEEITSAQPNG